MIVSRSSRHSEQIQWLGRLLIIIFSYIVSGRLGLAIPYVGSLITLFWLPTGIAVAAFMRWGWRCWLGVFIGAFLTNLSMGASYPLALGIAVGNTMAPLLVAWLLKHTSFNFWFDRTKDIPLFGLAAFLGMLVSALCGTSMLLITGLLTWNTFPAAFFAWWLGDAVGVLLAGPFLLTVTRNNLAVFWQRRKEFVVWIMSVCVLGFLVFFSQYEQNLLPLAFLFLPLVVWAALSFGQSGATLAAMFISLLAALATSMGRGPFSQLDTQQGLFLLWLYMSTLILSGLIVTTLLVARKQAEGRANLLLESVSNGVWGLDTSGITTFVNSAASVMLGYATDELIGKPMHVMVHHSYPDGSHYPLERCPMYATLVDGKYRTVTDEVLWRKNGSSFTVEYTTHPIYNNNTLIGSVVVFQDITKRKLAEQEIRDQQARLNGLIDAAMDAIVSTDENQNIIIFNHGAEQMFGYRAADIIGQHLDLLIPIRFRQTHSRHVDEFGKTGITTRTMNQLGRSFGLRANGEEFPFETSISRVEVAGKIIYTAILRDSTLRKQAESELRIAAAAFESQEGMLITDAKGVILRVNQAFTNTTGYTAEEAVGQTPRLLQSGRHNADFYRAMWEAINRTGAWQGEIWDRRKNGEIYPKWLTITAVKGNDGVVTHYVGSHIDITERKAAEDKITNLAFYDPLTLLPNRRLLLDRLNQALAYSARSGREGALMFIDLDNFKTLNDTLGHDIGDLLLQQVAQRLELCVREGDTVARLGGDEFVVMLEDLSKDSLEAAAQTETVGEKILATLNQPYQLATHKYHSTPSIGATLFAEHKSEVDVLFKQADIAMYQAKKYGRNTLRFFDPQMQDTVNVRAALESELYKALENRQFHLYYQIQVDDSRRPLGAEALIRWIHPERGLVSPAQFIPLAEETGLILSIGQWVLETACARLKAWQQDVLTRDLVLAVNVSSRQFRQTDFVTQVQATVQRHAINPVLLKLELTESMLLEDIENTIATMSILKAIGVRFSLDDFGTGYSSLQYLKRLPLDQLKIDRSFVRDLASDSNDRAIVRTIIAMAGSLNMDVIAEGVETEDQRQCLQNMGCAHYQGYLFSKPVPIEQFEALLAL